MLYSVVLVSAAHQRESVIEDSFFFFLKVNNQAAAGLEIWKFIGSRRITCFKKKKESPAIVMGIEQF